MQDYGGRVEIGLPWKTSKTGGPLKYFVFQESSDRSNEEYQRI